MLDRLQADGIELWLKVNMLAPDPSSHTVLDRLQADGIELG